MILKPENDQKMPWPVRIALGWFVLLAIACCAPLVYVQTLWREGWGFGWMLWQHIACFGAIALGAGFVAAILCGRRNWVTIPYFLIGLLFFCLPMINSGTGLIIYRVAVAVGTVVPLVLLYGPSSSNLWFLSFPLQRGLGTGCCTLLVLAIVGLMASMVDVAPPTRKNYSALMGVTASRGLNMFVLLTRNEAERAAGAQGVDVAACTNSAELAEKIGACFGGDPEEMARVGRMWSFAVNVPPGAPDTFPVMITANVDPAELPREWDGKTDKDKLLELKPLEGVEPLRFGDKAIVIVRKGGAAQVIKRKYMKLKTIFGDKPFKLGKDTYYLTPVGRR